MTQSPEGDFVWLLPQLQLPGLGQLKLLQQRHEVPLRGLGKEA
jgi:hypothetical protein